MLLQEQYLLFHPVDKTYLHLRQLPEYNGLHWPIEPYMEMEHYQEKQRIYSSVNSEQRFTRASNEQLMHVLPYDEWE